MNVTVCMYGTTGESLNTNIQNFDLNNIYRSENTVRLFNDDNTIIHEFYKCGNVKEIAEYPLFSYYLEGTSKFYIFVCNSNTFNTNMYPSILNFLFIIFKIHNLKNIDVLNMYMPNKKSPVTQLCNASEKRANEYEFARRLSAVYDVAFY